MVVNQHVGFRIRPRNARPRALKYVDGAPIVTIGHLEFHTFVLHVLEAPALPRLLWILRRRDPRLPSGHAIQVGKVKPLEAEALRQSSAERESMRRDNRIDVL